PDDTPDAATNLYRNLRFRKVSGRQLLGEGARHSERVLVGWLHEIGGPGQAAARAACQLPGRRQLRSPPMRFYSSTPCGSVGNFFVSLWYAQAYNRVQEQSYGSSCRRRFQLDGTEGPSPASLYCWVTYPRNPDL